MWYTVTVGNWGWDKATSWRALWDGKATLCCAIRSSMARWFPISKSSGYGGSKKSWSTHEFPVCEPLQLKYLSSDIVTSKGSNYPAGWPSARTDQWRKTSLLRACITLHVRTWLSAWTVAALKDCNSSQTGASENQWYIPSCPYVSCQSLPLGSEMKVYACFLGL